MGLFEEQPWLLVPFVLVVVIGYDVVKWGVRRLLDRSQGEAPRERRS
jgi:hypothetical protein